MIYYIILVLIIVGMGLWVWYLLKNKKEDEKEILAIEKERDELADFGKGLEEYNRKMQEKKKQAKAKIMKLFEKKGKINHRDVVKALDVSKNSAVRYLDELEADGKVKQVGKTGHAVFYTKI